MKDRVKKIEEDGRAPAELSPEEYMRGAKEQAAYRGRRKA